MKQPAKFSRIKRAGRICKNIPELAWPKEICQTVPEKALTKTIC